MQGNRQEENFVLKGEDSEKVPELKDFRSYVDDLECSFKEQVFIKILYLTAAKPSELLTKTTPYQFKHNKSKPYGSSLRCDIRKHKTTLERDIQILYICLEVAKRAKEKKMGTRGLQDDYVAHQGEQAHTGPSELVKAISAETHRVRMRVVPVPISVDYEPWCYDLLKWIGKEKGRRDALALGFTEMTAQNIVKRNFSKLNPAINPRLIRKFRITHLMKNYDFNPYQIALFTGCSASPMFKSIGMEAPSSKDSYYKKQWVDLIDKLLVPLDKVF